MNAAYELYERQNRYDMLHHRMRAEWIRSGQARATFGPSLARTLLRQSEAYINNPRGPGGRAVDLQDSAYLVELDAFTDKSGGVAAGA